MTIHTNIAGYQERPYLSEGYLSAGQYGNDGMQVFAKIVNIPRERHNSKGRKLDCASFTLELGESK